MNKSGTIWKYLSAAPHRSLFLMGAFQAVLTILWWVIELAGRAGLMESVSFSSIMPIWVHGFLMVYTFFPFFILGFLFTTFPNWMNGEKIKANQYMTVCLLMAAGVVLFYAGLIAGKFLLSAGLLLMLSGWRMPLLSCFMCCLQHRPGISAMPGWPVWHLLPDGWDCVPMRCGC